MKKIIFILFVTIAFVSCKNSNNKIFTVSGKITNATGKMAYLEQLPIGTMRPLVVDSVPFQKDGSFSLKTKSGEACIYNVRLDNSLYPIASVINDQPSVTVDVTMSQTDNRFPEKYDVKGSPASQSMKEFMTGFNDKMKNVFVTLNEIDSLRSLKMPDSLLAPKIEAGKLEAATLKDYTLGEIKKSNNAALTMFELGYYQSVANNPGSGLAAITDDQVMGIIDDVIKKNPSHKGIGELKYAIVSQKNTAAAGSWTGKAAPDFTLPDVNGKPISLSSLKGKFVLVDFWASWCRPCRMENPNVVAAYNKFKDKNFTVLGVSLDENKEAWLKAIQSDKLTWQHVSDLKQWSSMVIPLYKFDGIPYNVLIDPQGKIIAESLRGHELEAKLAEVLK
jgi:peroxiredoxin